MLEITKNLKNTFGIQLLAKLRQFIYQSLLRYILASIMLVVAGCLANYVAMDIGSITLHLILSVAALSGISMFAIFISAYVLARQKQYAVIVLQKDVIELSGGASGVIDRFGYDRLDQVVQNNMGLIFSRQGHPAHYVFLARNQFTDNEYSTLLGWLEASGKL